MARKIRSPLESRTSRDALSVGKRIHWQTLSRGKLSLGYRRLHRNEPGEWLKRVYVGTDDAGIGHYRQNVIGEADDRDDANGVRVLDYEQAQERAWGQDKPTGPLTVRAAIEHYVEFIRSRGQATTDTEKRAAAHILPFLGDELVEDLTAEQLRKWHLAYAEKAAWHRIKKGEARKAKAAPTDEEAVRRRRSSANRLLTILKATLNHAFAEGRVSSNAAWTGKRVAPFKGVDAPRLRYLTIADSVRLVNACQPDFRLLVRAALESGARYSELARLRVHDFNTDVGTVHIRKSKSGKPRDVNLTDDGARFFRDVTMGRAGDELIFQNKGRLQRAYESERERLRRAGKATDKIEIVDPGDWRKGEQGRLMSEAVKRAKIKPAIGFHGLRHTYASHCAMNGMALLVLAKNLGHRDTSMCERHYAHLAPSHVAESIREHAPKFGFKVERANVRALKR
jgi:integrase